MELPTHKTCTKCGEVKIAEYFYKTTKNKSGLSARCKECLRDDQTLYRTAHTAEHRARNAEYRAKNPEATARLKTKWRNNNIELARQQAREGRRRARKTPRGKLEQAISVAVYSSLVRGSKAGRTWEKLVGYSVDDLTIHLEKLFLPGMTWENYGRGGWHVDHKIPLAAHNYEIAEHGDFKRAWALKNLQPMWARENIIKGAKLSAPFQPSLLL